MLLGRVNINNFLIYQPKTYVVCFQKNSLNETILASTQNKCFKLMDHGHEMYFKIKLFVFWTYAFVAHLSRNCSGTAQTQSELYTCAGLTVNLVLVCTTKNNYFPRCTNY